MGSALTITILAIFSFAHLVSVVYTAIIRDRRLGSRPSPLLFVHWYTLFCWEIMCQGLLCQGSIVFWIILLDESSFVLHEFLLCSDFIYVDTVLGAFESSSESHSLLLSLLSFMVLTLFGIFIWRLLTFSRCCCYLTSEVAFTTVAFHRTTFDRCIACETSCCDIAASANLWSLLAICYIIIQLVVSSRTRTHLIWPFGISTLGIKSLIGSSSDYTLRWSCMPGRWKLYLMMARDSKRRL